LTVVFVLFAAACGGSIADRVARSDDAGVSAPIDAAPDRTIDAEIQPEFDATADAGIDATLPDGSCFGPCALGQTTCLGDGVATCVGDGRGCTTWGTPAVCGANEICSQSLIHASCTCKPGTDGGSGTCVAVIGAPRPIAPLSTAKTTSQKPTFHWVLAPNTDAAQVEICHDRACGTVEATFTSTGASGAPAAALKPGMHFWRMRGSSNGTVGTEISPTWEVRIGARNIGDASWGAVPDIDGDGYADVVIGSVNSNRYADYAIYPGGPGGLASAPATVHGPITGYGSFDLRGITVATAGDTNGDGYVDIVSTTLGDNANGANVAILHLYFGGPSGLVTPSLDLATQGTTYLEFIGPITASAAGDVNGDGYGDVIATTSTSSPYVYLFYGGPNGPSTSPLTLFQPADTTSLQVAGAGDTNGDGFGDVLVFSTAGNRSDTYLYLGGPSGPSATPIPILGGDVTGVDDVDGDGYADFIAGAYLYYGSAKPTAPLSILITKFGVPIAPAGDVNGDGRADFLVGQESVAEAFLYYGSGFRSAANPITLTGSGQSFGGGVGGLGDVDGDGYDELLISSPTSPSVTIFMGSSAGPASPPIVLTTSYTSGFAALY
jgi:hypothetical protein